MLISIKCSNTIQPARRLKSHIHRQNRSAAGRLRRRRREYVIPAAWMTTHIPMRHHAARSFQSMVVRQLAMLVAQSGGAERRHICSQGVIVSRRESAARKSSATFETWVPIDVHSVFAGVDN